LFRPDIVVEEEDGVVVAGLLLSRVIGLLLVSEFSKEKREKEAIS